MLFKTIDCICCTKERGEAKVLFSKRRIRILVTRTVRRTVSISLHQLAVKYSEK